MHWCAECGVEACAPCASRPGIPSGHHHGHLDHVLPAGKADGAYFYKLTVPTCMKNDIGRAERPFTKMVPHEQTDEDMKRAYWEHPSVAAHSTAATPVHPVSIFIDGVPYSHTDGAIGSGFVNCLTGRRYLSAVIRKNTVCTCGCRGWCSMIPIFCFIRWSLGTMAAGRFPSARRHTLATERHIWCSQGGVCVAVQSRNLVFVGRLE